MRVRRQRRFPRDEFVRLERSRATTERLSLVAEPDLREKGRDVSDAEFRRETLSLRYSDTGRDANCDMQIWNPPVISVSEGDTRCILTYLNFLLPHLHQFRNLLPPLLIRSIVLGIFHLQNRLIVRTRPSPTTTN